MLPTTNPLVKTATDLRRSINRLEVFQKAYPDDETVLSGDVTRITEELKEARRHIPKQFRDTDLADD